MTRPFLKNIVLAGALLSALSANAATFYFKQPSVGLQPAAAPQAKAPSLKISPANLSFSAEAGSASALQSLSLKNEGTAALILGSLSVQGTDAAAFRIASDSCSGATLAVGDVTGCSVSLQFIPGTAGSKQATLSVAGNVAGGVKSVSLSGTASTPVDSQAGQVSLLMHMEGSNGGTLFADSALGHTITRVGTPTISTTTAAVGSSSANLPYGSFLQITPQGTEFQFPGDFTIEGWVLLNNPGRSGPQTIFGMKGATYFDVRWYSYRFQMTANAGNGTNMGGTIAANTWTHLAWVRYNGVITLYVNGVSTGTKINNANTLGLTGTSAQIGSTSAIGENMLDGAVDEIRVTQMARYTANFTPSNAPFPNP